MEGGKGRWQQLGEGQGRSWAWRERERERWCFEVRRCSGGIIEVGRYVTSKERLREGKRSVSVGVWRKGNVKRRKRGVVRGKK